MNLIEACRYGNVDRVTWLLKNGVDTIEKYNIAIQLASKYGHAKVVALLLQDGRADPTFYDSTVSQTVLVATDPHAWPGGIPGVIVSNGPQREPAIVLAGESSRVVKALLQDGRADPTFMNNEAIRRASDFGHIKIVSLLLQDGRSNPADCDNYALRYASYRGHTKVVKALLDDGRVEVTDWAISNAKTVEIKKMLLRYKYRVDGLEYCKMKHYKIDL